MLNLRQLLFNRSEKDESDDSHEAFSPYAHELLRIPKVSVNLDSILKSLQITTPVTFLLRISFLSLETTAEAMRTLLTDPLPSIDPKTSKNDLRTLFDKESRVLLTGLQALARAIPRLMVIVRGPSGEDEAAEGSSDAEHDDSQMRNDVYAGLQVATSFDGFLTWHDTRKAQNCAHLEDIEKDETTQSNSEDPSPLPQTLLDANIDLATDEKEIEQVPLRQFLCGEDPESLEDTPLHKVWTAAAKYCKKHSRVKHFFKSVGGYYKRGMKQAKAALLTWNSPREMTPESWKDMERTSVAACELMNKLQKKLTISKVDAICTASLTTG
eukprot:GHVT01082857.1.p1 GENE.GHVT01082857.1~~GHVT01082857.1.p1  ORF type:complete len:326 (-),score=60.51 GHVT01082857.1:379-1356(-)